MTPGRHSNRKVMLLALLAAVLLLFAGHGLAQDGGPTKHFTLDNPADLTDADAQAIYRRLIDKLTLGYRLSGDLNAEAYPRWRRFNTAPYRSETHGHRFVNNYVNGIGRAYGSFREGDSMPLGSIIAKDSFAVTEGGDVFSGPLFLMEKMAYGFNVESRDWRYTMIMPDGSLFGVTKGQAAGNVAFCITCHAKAGDENDHLYFVPEALRIEASPAAN